MPESTRDRERTFEAATAEEALSLVAEELGTDAEILAIERVTKGGIAGFFAKELVQIRARLGDDTPRTVRELEAPVIRPAVAARASRAAAEVVREPVHHEAGRPVAGGVAGVLAQMLGQAEEREETFAEHLQARLATVPAGAPASTSGTGRDSIDLTAFDNPSHQPTPQERVAALRREAERTRRGASADDGTAATASPARPASTSPDPAAQAAREEALRALILAEAAGGAAAPEAPAADVQQARADALRALVLDEARAAVRAAAEADPSPLALPAVTSRGADRPANESAFEPAFGARSTIDDEDGYEDDDLGDDDHDELVAAAPPVDVVAAAPPTGAEIRAVEDRAAAAIAALRAERRAAAEAPAPPPVAAPVAVAPAAPVAVAPVAPPMAPAEQVMAEAEAESTPEVRRPLWRLVNAAATDSHPGTGPVDWGVDALVHMGLPLALVRPAFELDPRDDLAWIEALAGAVATYCRPLPGGPQVLAGPRADRIGSAMGLEVTPFPEAPAYGGSVCLKTKADGPGRAWLSKVRGDRWLHVVAGGDWEDLVAKDPLAVSWVGLDALVPALQLCASRGLVLGYGTPGGPGAPVARAHPVEVALAIRSLVPRQ